VSEISDTSSKTEERSPCIAVAKMLPGAHQPRGRDNPMTQLPILRPRWKMVVRSGRIARVSFLRFCG
jgi:hypothetical protein